MTNTLLYINLSHFILKKGDVCCVWEMSGDQEGLLYWPKFFLAHSSTSFASWLGSLNRGSLRAQSPQSASWFSRWHPVSKWFKPSGHLVILFFNVHLPPLFFRLFTQVYLLIDGSVEGQYITIVSFLFFKIPHVDIFFTFLSIPLTHTHAHLTNNAQGQQQQKYKKKLLEQQQNTKILIRRRPSQYVTLAQANYYLNLFHTILCEVGCLDMRASKYNTDASFILPKTIGPSPIPWRISKP